jgi:hypothetical protein
MVVALATSARSFTTSVTRKACFLRRSPVTAMASASPNPLIKVASSGMGLIKPLFVAEAQVQAAVLGGIAGVSDSDVEAEIEADKSANPILIYTYGLSPFSTEALSLLDSTGYEYTKIELGLEWFALGGNGSKKRTALAGMVENGATSLPKIFIGGAPLGGASGYSALAEAIESGQLEGLLKSSGAKKTS